MYRNFLCLVLFPCFTIFHFEKKSESFLKSFDSQFHNLEKICLEENFSFLYSYPNSGGSGQNFGGYSRLRPDEVKIPTETRISAKYWNFLVHCNLSLNI